jgi:hypothetical protein
VQIHVTVLHRLGAKSLVSMCTRGDARARAFERSYDHVLAISFAPLRKDALRREIESDRPVTGYLGEHTQLGGRGTSRMSLVHLRAMRDALGRAKSMLKPLAHICAPPSTHMREACDFGHPRHSTTHMNTNDTQSHHYGAIPATVASLECEIRSASTLPKSCSIISIFHRILVHSIFVTFTWESVG